MDNKPYRSLNEYYREIFGRKTAKISLDGGFTCPNRDGRCGTRGCLFCSAGGSGDFAENAALSITEQVEQGKTQTAEKWKDPAYIAYFQAFTNTYAPVEELRRKYEEALSCGGVEGISIATRADCLPEDVIALLREINAIKPVTVELGLQTVHPETVRYIRRGYETPVYFDAVRRLKAAGLEVVTHIIIGLPGETPEMAAETTRQAVAAGTDGVKFHLLHVLRGTDLEQDYLKGMFRCLELEEYAHWLKRCLKEVPPHVTVHRITGDGARRNLVAPLWSEDKKRVLNYLKNYLGQ